MSNFPSQSLLEELQALLGPRGFTRDPSEMAPWLQDWRKRFHGKAAAMLSPSTTEDVSHIISLCASHRVPVVPQGGNSSMSGGATPLSDGSAFLLSLRRMNRIRVLSAEQNLAICEAGVILSHLHEEADSVGRRFPLTLGAKGSATIGGLVSTNAGGTQVLRFGTMRGLVQGLEAVLPDGTVYHGLSALKKDNRGYDLRHLFIGAEGTLGVVTAATLKLVPAVAARAVAWVGLDAPEAALSLLRFLEDRTGDSLEGFELVPKAALDLVLEHIPGTRSPLSDEHGWHALVEVTAPAGAPDPSLLLQELLESALERGMVEDAIVAASEAQAYSFWRIRDSISEAERAEGEAAKHDISVEVAKMPAFIIEASSEVERRFPGTKVIAFGHLGDGNIHFNVAGPRGGASDWLQKEGGAVTRLVHDLVTEWGGSISAEHGIGQLRLSELQRTGDPTRLLAMRAIKNALDPHGIMNPGKLVPLAQCVTGK